MALIYSVSMPTVSLGNGKWEKTVCASAKRGELELPTRGLYQWGSAGIAWALAEWWKRYLGSALIFFSSTCEFCEVINF